jgi:hypothetical protein
VIDLNLGRTDCPDGWLSAGSCAGLRLLADRHHDLTGLLTHGTATILGHTGDIDRFPTSGHFARYTGTAPIAASSGPTQRHRLNPRGKRQLNQGARGPAVADPPGFRRVRATEDQQQQPNSPGVTVRARPSQRRFRPVLSPSRRRAARGSATCTVAPGTAPDQHSPQSAAFAVCHRRSTC